MHRTAPPQQRPGSASAAAAQPTSPSAPFRARGNDLFAKGDFEAAIAEYTRAIQHDNTEAKLFTNRALCNLRLGKKDLVFQDAQRAIELDSNSEKGYYLKGKILLEKGDYDSAVRSLKRGYELASTNRQSPTFGNLFDAYFTALKRRHEDQVRTRQEAMRQAVDSCKAAMATAAAHAAEGQKRGGGGAAAVGDSLSMVEAMFHQVARPEDASPFQEMPQCFLCPLTLDVMRDPVLIVGSPEGITYDRQYITEHFAKRGWIEPISMKQLPPGPNGRMPELMPNVGLRSAIESFLEAQPWLFEPQMAM